MPFRPLPACLNASDRWRNFVVEDETRTYPDSKPLNTLALHLAPFYYREFDLTLPCDSCFNLCIPQNIAGRACLSGHWEAFRASFGIAHRPIQLNKLPDIRAAF